jgi:hypothetical protein
LQRESDKGASWAVISSYSGVTTTTTTTNTTTAAAADATTANDNNNISNSNGPIFTDLALWSESA